MREEDAEAEAVHVCRHECVPVTLSGLREEVNRRRRAAGWKKLATPIAVREWADQGLFGPPWVRVWVTGLPAGVRLWCVHAALEELRHAPALFPGSAVRPKVPWSVRRLGPAWLRGSGLPAGKRPAPFDEEEAFEHGNG